MAAAAPYYMPPGTSKPRLEAWPSVLLDEARDSTGSSSPMDHQWHSKPNGDANSQAQPITLGIAIRRTRLIAFTLFMVVVIVGLTVLFYHGVALTSFDSKSKNDDQETDLLDEYNSYAGNAASVFAKPIELFVTVGVQVVILRFMAGTFTRPEMGWKASAITLLLGAGIGFLIGNGFNALNVQLRPQEIETMILEQDLLLNITYTEDTRATSPGNTVSEMQKGNLVSNTVLRSAISPKAFRGGSLCPLVNTANATADEAKEAFVNLGFMQQDWQIRVLQEAALSTTLRVVVNPTNKSANDQVTSANLPMNASLAADLFYHAITISPWFFPWGDRHAFVNRSDIARRYPVNDTEPHEMQEMTTRLYGLLPQDSKADEATMKTWFLLQSMAAMSRQFAFANRTKVSDLVMEFSHTEITPTMAFDAVTFEVEIDPTLLATVAAANNATRYTVLNQPLHCPISADCMIPKTSYGRTDTTYDPPSQVFALAMCVNPSDNEILTTNFTRQNTTTFDDILDCPGNDTGSLQSMLTISISKRLIADALTQNMTVSSNGTTPNPDAATVTNLRKIYSFAVGRLSWTFTDLAEKFNARCWSEEKSACEGLVMKLGDPLDQKKRKDPVEQQVIIGKDKLPSHLLASPAGPLGWSRANLVLLDEPPQSPAASELYKAVSGDILLRHNIGNITWDEQSEEVSNACNADIDDRITQTLSNHMYMEHGLQTSYTSAMFFLFMYGSVKDVIDLSETKKSLEFDGNTQALAVWASTPAQNMWLTVIGCAVLVLGLLAALIKATWFTRKHDALANITQPQAIARAIIDERNYPPMFLHRRVQEKEGSGRIDENALAAQALARLKKEKKRGFRRFVPDFDDMLE